MKSEMDALGMDERQKLAWLRANRVTLICVGAVWIGIVVAELARGRTPYFMIAMVPAFALIRFLSYRLFVRAGG